MQIQFIASCFFRLILAYIFIVFSIHGASSSNSELIGQCVPVHEMQYSPSHDVLLQESLRFMIPMNNVVREMVTKAEHEVHVYHRLRYLLSSACSRSQEMSPKIKNKLLCWAAQAAHLDKPVIQLLLSNGANPYATLLSIKNELHPVVSFAADTALKKGASLKDVEKFKLILETDVALLHQSPSYRAVVQEKVRQQIMHVFDTQGFDFFMPHVEEWRQITHFLGVKSTIRRLVYSLLCNHTTQEYRNAFVSLTKLKPFDRFAVACEIYHFVWCVTYNLKYSHQAYDLDYYSFFCRTYLQKHKVHVERCREKTFTMYPLLNDQVKHRIELIKSTL